MDDDRCYRDHKLAALSLFFFFQAEDGIRDYKVTGVQTCALPILIKHQPSAEVALPAAAQRRAIFQARISGVPSGQARCSESVLWRTLTRKRQNWTPHFTRRSNRFSLGEVAGREMSNVLLSLPAVVGEWSRRG